MHERLLLIQRMKRNYRPYVWTFLGSDSTMTETFNLGVLMKYFLLAMAVLSAPSAFGEAFGVFSQAGDQVKVIVQGRANDRDALRLFEAMDVVEVVEGSTVMRRSVVRSSGGSSGDLIFDLSCRKSINVENLGSCTLQLDSDYIGTGIYLDDRSASMATYGVLDSFQAITQFFITEDTDEIFISGDRRLRIAVERESRSREITRLRVDYHNSGDL